MNELIVFCVMKIFHTVLRDWFFFTGFAIDALSLCINPSLKDWIFPLIRNGSYVLSYVLWQCPEYVSSLISNCKLETRCIYLATRFSVIQHRKPTDYRNPLLFKWIREVRVCLEMYISGIIPLVLPVYIWHSLTIPGICWILLLKVRKYLYVCCIGM